MDRDSAGHQGVAGVEKHHLVLLELEGGLEGGEGVHHLVFGVQHEAMPQALCARVPCSKTHYSSLDAWRRAGSHAPLQGPMPHLGGHDWHPGRQHSDPEVEQPQC